MTILAPIIPDLATDSLLDDYQLQRHGRLVSLAMPVPDVTPEQFLRYARGHARFFWRDGRSDLTLAGMGVAVDLMAWGEARFAGIQRQARELFAHAVHLEAVNAQALAALATPRLFGGFAFREDFVPDFAWHGFHPAHFVLPHYQLVQKGEQRWLTLNVLLPADQEPSQAAPQLREALAQCFAELRTFARGNIAGIDADEPPRQRQTLESTLGYPMPYATWAEMIGRAHGRFAEGELQKVVLARVCEVRQAPRVDLDGALAYLQSHYPECFTFLFEPQPGHAFFGATPELLAATRGRTLDTMALAGSIQRGRTPEEDAALADELLHSAKDRHEHALVVGSLRRRLESMVDDLALPDTPGVYTLRNIQHLHTPVRARLRSATGILPVVEALHPTPALGGTPRERALAFIREAESVPRGWYAGPVGWIDPNLDGAFGVAIRSAVAQQKRAWLYAGAGIVAASDPQKEWTETEWKFRPMQAALGIAP